MSPTMLTASPAALLAGVATPDSTVLLLAAATYTPVYCLRAGLFDDITQVLLRLALLQIVRIIGTMRRS